MSNKLLIENIEKEEEKEGGRQKKREREIRKCRDNRILI